jgi:hypothetical protein
VRFAHRSMLLLAICLLVPASAAAIALGDPGDGDGPLGPAAAEPTLGLVATSAGIGGAVHATATLAGGLAPTGSIDFSAFAPGDPTCAGPTVFTASAPVTDNGEYSSGDFTPSTAGAYNWSAEYSGDGENTSALASCAATSTIAQATPSIGTTASDTTVGGAISDSATISGGFSPTGQVVFKAFGPNDATCAGAVAFEKTVAVSGNGVYGSTNFTTTAAGAYRWTADYSGDANNDPASSACNAPNETSTVEKAAPVIATTATSAALGSPISDSATLSGGFSPTGQLVFKAFGPDDATCANAPAFEKTVAVSGNGAYGSTNFNGASLGAYRWTVAYSGDANNAISVSPCNAANETSTVGKASPALVTTASNGTAGGTIADSATLSGGVAPTGTIVFKAFGPADATCALTPAFEKSVAVSGNGVYGSTNFTTTTAGAYRWTADYSGDADNAAASSPCNAANETSTVAKASPGLATTASNGTAGGTIADSATISSGVAPTGSILFKAFGPNDATCAGAVAFEKSAAVSGNGSYESTNFSVTLAGAYRWTAAYSGDANNNAASSACNAANETSTVAKASPGIATTASNATVGSTIADSATISSGVAPTGTILFKAFGPNDATCAGAVAFEKSVAVSGNGSYGSTNFTTAAAGAYRWTASYSGDANNNAATSACNAANETSTVEKATPALSTTATSAPFGFPISDSATLSAGFPATGPLMTGTILFKAFGPNDATCAGAIAFEKTVAVNGNGSYGSTDFNGASLGAYRWTVAYSGDANNAAVTSGCNAVNETSTVGNANPTLTSVAASTTIGSPISDSATLAGGFIPTGQLTFKAFGPNDATCALTPAFEKTVAVNGNGSYGSTNFALPQLGTYLWTVSYSGDANNNPASSGCGAANEASVVSKFTPALSAAAGGAAVGSPIADIATFSGGSKPTGQIVFRAYGPNDPSCAQPPAFASTLDVTPDNGTYASGPFTPSKAGAYRWTATYSGDASNNSAATACGAMISAVAPATPTLSAKVSAASLAIGAAARDTAMLAGAFQPSGAITFRLFGPDDGNCSAAPVFTSTAAVAAVGSFVSGGFAPAAPGQYRFTASYSGDGANSPVATACSAAGQSLTVIKRAPTLSARAALRGGGSRIVARANLAGAAAPKGKVLFRLFGPNNSRCAGKPAFSERVTIHGGGSYAAAPYRPKAPGVYRLTVAYAGDAWNKPASSGCNVAGQSVRVGSK